MEPNELVKGKEYRVVAEQCYLKRSDAPRHHCEYRALRFGETIIYQAEVRIHGPGKEKKSLYIFTSDDEFTGRLTMMFEGAVGGLWVKPVDE